MLLIGILSRNGHANASSLDQTRRSDVPTETELCVRSWPITVSRGARAEVKRLRLIAGVHSSLDPNVKSVG